MMRCTCCGRWTAKTVVFSVPHYGSRERIRIRYGPYLVGDYTTAAEAARVLAEVGVLAAMVEELHDARQ